MSEVLLVGKVVDNTFESNSNRTKQKQGRCLGLNCHPQNSYVEAITQGWLYLEIGSLQVLIKVK